MDVKIYPSKLSGEIDPIASKSTMHRSLIAALMVQDKTTIKNNVFSEDALTTINILKEVGCKIVKNDAEIIIDSTNLKYNNQILNCNESGTTIRMILPVILYLFKNVKIDCKDGLKKRPMKMFEDIFNQNDQIVYDLNYPIHVKGEILQNKYYLAGNISSQFISGLLFILPKLEKDSVICFNTNIESAGYINLTIKILKVFGIKIKWINGEIHIKGNQTYQSNVIYTNEYDESNLAFWHVANYLGALIKLPVKNTNTMQPDAIISTYLDFEKTSYKFNQCPDILPIFSLAAANANKTIHLEECYRTTIKETNRLVASHEVLSKLGYKVHIKDDVLIINFEKPKINEVMFKGYNDHRMVMMLAISCMVIKKPIIINGFEVVNKSYPSFLKDFAKLNGKYKIVNNNIN